MKEPPVSHGSCLCGAVRFAARLPSKWLAHCHCTRCQRAHGAPFVTWAGFEQSQVEVMDAGALLRWYDAPEGGSRGFCSCCGSPMLFRSERWAGELHIARALFTEAVDREPQAHVFYDSHVPWVNVADNLPKKEETAG